MENQDVVRTKRLIMIKKDHKKLLIALEDESIALEVRQCVAFTLGELSAYFKNPLST